MDTFCENLAHFIHGAAFMFFILAFKTPQQYDEVAFL